MHSVGIRELRQQASELLRRVEQGETIGITDRGRPVAVLSPARAGRPFHRLRRMGEIEPATANLQDLPAPLVLPSGVERPSDALRRLRRDER
jgi:prevent-host-death family protein